MKDVFTFYIILLILKLGVFVNSQTNIQIPEDLQIGTATSAYQIEGAWNEDGKEENNWDHFTHYRSDKILDNSTGDIACDSYHKFEEDIAMMKDLGVAVYRFSLSWSRILPMGFANKINPAGLSYYNQLINSLLANKITPIVTIFHWDLPQILQNLGGFTNPAFSDWFEDYARVVFSNFGDRVKTWTTFNEPKETCHLGYGIAQFAPGYADSGIGDYMCTHNLLIAHARAYHLYINEFKKEQNGKVGIVIQMPWSEPASKKEEDIEAANRKIAFDVGMYANPIFSEDGDFPEVVKEFISKRSYAEGFKVSRLPQFTREEIQYIKGTSDYFGLNYYSTILTQHVEEAEIGEPSYTNDVQVSFYQCDHWITGSHPLFRLVPWGLRKALRYVDENYGNLDIYVTENGFPDVGQLDDHNRILYIQGHLKEITEAITKDSIAVKMYTIWSLLDNFEWARGYTTRFGLYHVDFNDPNRKRTKKESATFVKNLLSQRQFEMTTAINASLC